MEGPAATNRRAFYPSRTPVPHRRTKPVQPQDIAAGYPPEHNSPAELEQVLTEAAAQLPIVRLADAMTVEAYVLPYALGRVHPVCAWLEVGEHRIPTEFIWRDIANGEVYCHIKCAAKAAIDRADKGVPA